MKVVDANWENIDDFVIVCIREARRNHPAFQEDWRVKKHYLRSRLERNLPCIFVSKYQGRGINKNLFYQKNGFKLVSEKNPYLLNYPIGGGEFY